MFDMSRMKRLTRRLATAPARIQQVSDDVTILRQEMLAVRAEVAALTSRIDISTKSTLEALAFTTRSIDGLNARLDKMQADLPKGLDETTT
jgi:uncharacterized coiled-coil protein SlyX